MNGQIAVISGHKVLEDDVTRWTVFCYKCGESFGNPTIDPKELKQLQTEHIALHEENTPE